MFDFSKGSNPNYIIGYKTTKDGLSVCCANESCNYVLPDTFHNASVIDLRMENQVLSINESLVLNLKSNIINLLLTDIICIAMDLYCINLVYNNEVNLGIIVVFILYTLFLLKQIPLHYKFCKDNLPIVTSYEKYICYIKNKKRCNDEEINLNNIDKYSYSYIKNLVKKNK